MYATATGSTLQNIYVRLHAHYGPQQWWPADSLWEIMVGAVLTQNTAWRNVEYALANLKRANALAPARIRALRRDRLARLIRPAGFTSSKPQRLKTLAEFLRREYGDAAENMRNGVLDAQRKQLLALNGIGPETADAILLYVAEQPIFVIDAYTRRIVARVGLADAQTSYHALQEFFMAQLPRETALFQEFHALLDVHAKSLCTKRAPRCAQCPLRDICLKKGVS
jgi:endonuclease-3 related protein